MADVMDYVGENQRILDRWRLDYVQKNQSLYPNCSNLGDYFTPDGIMYKGEIKETYVPYGDGKTGFRWERKPSGLENELWANAPIRVLYLTKDQNTGDCEAWDVRGETYRYPDKDCPPEKMYLFSQNIFFRNLVYSLYGIMNTTHIQKQEYDFTNEDALRFVDSQIYARINCKKEVGGDQCNNNLLRDAINNDAPFLKEQIDNLKADIFICCGYSKSISDTGNLMLNFLNTIDNYHFEPEIGDWIYYDETNNRIAINSYHLSYLGFDYNGMISAYHEFLKKHPDFTKSHRAQK